MANFILTQRVDHICDSLKFGSTRSFDINILLDHIIFYRFQTECFLFFIFAIKTGCSSSLPWLTRMKIALDAAKGLAFLHGEKKPVIYRDFKASNILLDSVIIYN